MTDKPDEIDELINNICMHSVVKDGVLTIVYEGLSPKDLKAKLLALKSKWEAEARLDEWDYAYECMRAANDTASLYLSKERDIRFAELNQLTTNGDK